MSIFDPGHGGVVVTEPAERGPVIPPIVDLPDWAKPAPPKDWPPRRPPRPSPPKKNPPRQTPPRGGGDGDASDLTKAEDATVFIRQLKAQFWWIEDMGFTFEWLQEVAAENGNNPDAILMAFRERPEYRKRFPGLWRGDGSIRMDEATYLKREKEYESLLIQYGIPEKAWKRPADKAGFFENEIDPNELSERLNIYATIRDTSQPIREAFYVYSGIDLSVDDLFEAVVDETIGSRLRGQYQKNSGNLDYDTFIDRAADVAAARVEANNKAKFFADSGRSLPGFAIDGGQSSSHSKVTGELNQRQKALYKTYLDQLYRGTDDDATPLDLQSLLAAVVEAEIGAAAQAGGFTMPSKKRVGELRAAGVTAAQARQVYGQFGAQQTVLSANMKRAGFGNIGRRGFEEAAFFGNAAQQRRIQTAQAYAESVGRTPGNFRFEQTGDRFMATGLR